MADRAAPGYPDGMEAPRLAKLAKWAPPLLLGAVASVQLAAAQLSPLTRWRGGGFGMYAEIHPDARRVWIDARPEGCAGEAAPGPTPTDVAPRLHHAQRAASRTSLEALARSVVAARDLSGCREVTGELFAPELLREPPALGWRSLTRVTLAVRDLE
ncbi:MAG: hypothetical protein QNK05_16260 [Myxococcota bacterium]|nr:hypothetical protein [Myxococcota bacterium]